MEAVSVLLPAGERWTCLCGQAAAPKPGDVVVRAFESAVLCAVGDAERGPDSEPILIPAGQGRRVIGTYVFARVANPGQTGHVSYRGA